MIIKKSVEDFDVRGKRVLVRCDFNVPVKDGVIIDSARILASMKTIRYLIGNGAKVILMSHFGRPKGKPDEKYSLSFVARYLEVTLSKKVFFSDDDTVVGPDTKKLVANLKDGDVLLLQNTRFRPEEEANDKEFSKELASLGDIFINDAFGTAHRSHASTVGVAEFLPSGAGYLLKKEIDILSDVMESPESPFVAVLGGSKVSDKIGVIENLLDKVDTLIIGGGMVFTFFAAQGLEVGTSLLEEDKIPEAKSIMEKAEAKGVQILFPDDIVIADSFSNDAFFEVVDKRHIKKNMMGLDIGPASVKKFTRVISEARTVLWNGPMGVFEMEQFAKGTFGVAEAMALCKGTTVVGGGDSAAAVDMAGLTSRMTHVSTGGGASLTFFKGETLPGIAALDDKERGKLICGNWKMNTTISEGLDLLDAFKSIHVNGGVKVAICPPYTHLVPFREALKDSHLHLGAQNVCDVDAGAYTGEISARVLSELDVDYCIIGHSERRLYYNETDKGVNLKAKQLLAHDITPILCCGEPLSKREKGQEEEYVRRQIMAGFSGISHEDAESIVVAYEPIWAIGTGKTATEAQAESMCALIRRTLRELGYGGENILILYGGSVNETNAHALIHSPNIDGALVGGASLKKDAFLEIIEQSK